MGSCMSKGKRKRKSKHQNHNHVDDDDDEKLVISQASTSPSPLLANIAALSPSKSPASITSTSSLSSSISCPSSEFSTTSSSSISSSSSSLSSSSSWSTSVLISKERSFSNEFLRSCAKENPHIIGLDPIRERSEKYSSMSKRIDSSPSKRSVQRRQSINQERLASSTTPRKRARNYSPMAVRQKSLRRELDRVSSSNNLPSRAMRSPSPSRRFNTDSPRRVSINATKESHYKGTSMASMVNNVSYGVSSSVKRDLAKPTNGNYDLSRRNSSIKSEDSPIQQVGAKIAEITVGEMQAKMDMDSILMEDINNPHIALDCFIFL